MPIHKRKYKSGKVVWFYQFDGPESTRANRRIVKESGFATRGESVDAEAARRTAEQQKFELMKRGGQPAPIPTSLATLLNEFFVQHAEEKLAAKTVERYRYQAAYLDPELLKMPLGEITSLHLSREWSRLLKNGGHTRGKRTPRPLSAKTVRNIAGVVSSAIARAIKWGLVTINPVTASEPPVPKKRRGIALTPAQQVLVFEAATSPWFLKTFLQMAAATGARRGELLALRWADMADGRAAFTRSLSQTKRGLEFKCTKTEDRGERVVTLPSSIIAALAAHRKCQDTFRVEFGPGYRADLDLIFANPDGMPSRPDSISSSVSALCRRLKLPKGVSLHSLRHSHGSHLLAAGMEITAVSERLGHSSPRVTQDIYSHAIHGRDDEAARRWDEFQKVDRRDEKNIVQ